MTAPLDMAALNLGQLIDAETMWQTVTGRDTGFMDALGAKAVAAMTALLAVQRGISFDDARLLGLDAFSSTEPDPEVSAGGNGGVPVLSPASGT